MPTAATGISIEPGTRELTRIVVDVGHLWGQREVVIPFGNVAGFDDGIRLNITRQQVKDLTATA